MHFGLFAPPASRDLLNSVRIHKICKMKRFIVLSWFVLLLVLMNSCNLDNVDFRKLSDEVSLNPTFVAPLVSANITGWDLFQTANKVQEPGGLIRLVYRQNDLVKFNVRDFMNLPTQQRFSSLEKEVGEISPGNITRTREISLSELINKLGGGLVENGANVGINAVFPAYTYSGPEVQFELGQITEYTSIYVSGGAMVINLENMLKVPVTIKGILFDTGNNRKISDFSFTNIAPGGFSKNSVSLSGLQISNKVEFRLVMFETSGSASEVNINLSDYLRVSFELTGLKISSGNVMVKSQLIDGSSGAFGFVFPEPDVKAFSAILKKGTVNIRIVNPSKLNGSVNLLLNEIKRNGSAIQASIPLSGNSTTIDLSGTEINFSSDFSNPYNQIPYSYSVQLENSNGYIDFVSSDALKIDISLTDLDFQSLYGDFGQQKMLIDPGKFEMEVFNKLGGDFKVTNPKFYIILHNSIGMPAVVSLKLTASNKEGQTDALHRNPATFDIPVPADIHSGIASGTVEYNKQNSNLVDFIALPPNSKVSFSGEIDFNKGNAVTPSSPNFLDAQSTFSADMELELPMELQINALSFSDTSGITGDSFNKIESAELLVTAKNGIPLDLDMQLYFIDTISKVQFGTSKRTKILSAAKVDAAGEYIPFQETNTFILDKSEMDNLRKANAVVFSGTLISPLGKDKVVSILSSSRIEMNVVMKSKFNL
jgi:hypothetical protein